MKAIWAAVTLLVTVVVSVQEVRPSSSASFRAANQRLRAAHPLNTRVMDLPPSPFGDDAPPQSRVAPPEQTRGRIIDGEEAAPCQFPHQMALRLHLYYGTAFCGGSLVAPRWVLTAAHCVDQVYRGVDVSGGSNALTGVVGVVARKAKRIFFHGDFDWHLRNDVALIELDEEVPLSECLKPVALERAGCDSNDLDNVEAIVSGWGNTEAGSMPANLLWTKATTITNADCLEAYNSDHVDRRTICTMPSNAAHQGTLCQGDSGGALLRADTGTQIGINSFTSIEGCLADLPSGYARVPCLIDWIEHVMTL